MNQRRDVVWQSSAIVDRYLTGVRQAVPLAAEQIQIMQRVIAAREKPVDNFLDLGCGDGILGAAVLAQYPTAKGVLFDFSEPMLTAAQEKLAEFDNQLTFLSGDYATSDWLRQVESYAPFDVIVSGYSIHHQPDDRKQTLYQEIYNLLKRDGLFLNVEHVASPTPWVEALWNNCFIDGMYEFHQRQGSSKSQAQLFQEFFDAPDRSANILASVEVQCDWLRQIGFADVDCFFKVFELAVFGGRRL